MFELISQIFKYIFILIIYLFIISILRLMYLDIKTMNKKSSSIDAAYLKVVNRLDTLDFKMQEYYILKGKVTIGRSSRASISIRDNFVSKNHAVITESKNSFFLEDLDSANGTFLNGEKVEDIIELKNGDRLGIGLIQFIFVDNRG
ncbi:FHA domain-containing protein [Anaerosphaera multitolerans]|uniref:FHA domain-containing protein n=1 Tax=Anaerosphaera multitolerans TaxID=2487351 RepID=A0A437S7N0_9FIRM|nr:FHA domain-containing protein [Anaerosphaera multitolerans]RVU54931.1 FHA domain-containing protein [Anaerosphaera multitolerans]